MLVPAKSRHGLDNRRVWVTMNLGDVVSSNWNFMPAVMRYCRHLSDAAQAAISKIARQAYKSPIAISLQTDNDE